MFNLLHRLQRRLRAVFNQRTVDRELDKEMRGHIALEAEDLARTKGLTPAEAARQAVIAFGGVARFTEEHHDTRRVRWFTEFWVDVRYAARSLARAPGYTLSATLVLALGIGASIAVFSAVDAVVLARLPYPDDAQLVRIFTQATPADRWTLSVADVQAIEKYSRTISAVGTIRSGRVNVSAGGDAERLGIARANAGFFTAIGVTLAAGRALAVDEEGPGAPGTVVLGYAYAVRKFKSAAGAVDSIVTIDGVAHRVVGVLRPEHATLAGFSPDMWPVLTSVTPTRRGPFGIFVFARLRPGVTIDEARRDLSGVNSRIYAEWSRGYLDSTRKLAAYSLREAIIGTSSRTMALFGGAVVLVLLIAVTNVASLSIVRSMRRWREISLRAVLGASRARLVRLIVAESLVLSAVAGVVGVAIGWGGLELLQTFATTVPRLNTARVDGRDVVLAIALSLAVGVAIGIVPALRLILADRGEKFRHGARTIGDSRHANRLRAVFVGAEFALALPLLAAGGLLLNSLMRLQRVNPGFDAHGIATLRVGVPSGAYRDNAELGAFWGRLAANVSRIPGVTAVSFGTAVPPNNFGNSNNNFDLVDAPVAGGQAQPSVTWPSANAEFFTALGVPLREGRLFVAGDTASGADTAGTGATSAAPTVIVVTEAWAKRYSPGRSAVGREIIGGGCTTCPRTVIVGVVGDILLDRLSSPGVAVFSPLSQGWPTQLDVFVKSSASVAALTPLVREAIRSADPSAAPGPMTSMEDQIYASVAQPRHWATILIVFAVAALVMAAVGVFGLLSYAVELRRREIGVRMALGAQSSRVVSTMIAGGMRCAAIGSALGIVFTLGVSRWMEALLFEVSAVDPVTLLIATAGLLGVAAVACWVPSRRAAGIDPTEAMRGE